MARNLVLPYLGEGEGLGGLLGGMGLPSAVNRLSVDVVDLTVSDRKTAFPPSMVIICRARVFFLYEDMWSHDCRVVIT